MSEINVQDFNNPNSDFNQVFSELSQKFAENPEIGKRIEAEAQKAIQENTVPRDKFVAVQKAFDEAVAKSNTALQELNEKLAKQEIIFEEAEAKNKKLSKRLEDLEDLSMKAGSSNDNGFNRPKSETMKGFEAYLRAEGNENNVHWTDEQKSIFQASRGDRGGILVPSEISNNIIFTNPRISPVEEYARVQTVEGIGSISFPVDKGGITSGFVCEDACCDESNANFEEVTINLEQICSKVSVSKKLLLTSESVINWEEYFGDRVSRQMALAENTSYLLGDGIGQPLGLVADNNGVDRIATINSSEIILDDLLNLQGNLHSQYSQDAIFGMNKRTLSHLKSIKTNDGHYQLAACSPMLLMEQNGSLTFCGNRIDARFEQMDDGNGTAVPANNEPVFFGDIREAYQIVRRSEMWVYKDETPKGCAGLTMWTFYKLTGGAVVKPEAMSILNVSA